MGPPIGRLAGDLIFTIDDVDLSAIWGWIPLLDVARAFEDIADRLTTNVSVEELFEFTESESTIRFRRSGDEVVVVASYVDGVATVDLAEMRDEVCRFRRRVLVDAVQRHPELRANRFLAALARANGRLEGP